MSSCSLTYAPHARAFSESRGGKVDFRSIASHGCGSASVYLLACWKDCWLLGAPACGDAGVRETLTSPLSPCHRSLLLTTPPRWSKVRPTVSPSASQSY